MEAAARGAKSAGGLTIGILPGDRADDANPHIDIPIATDMGHARNVVNVRAADAVVGVGGSYGTVSEMEEAIKLCIARNKGVYFMKALGGGCLVKEYHEAVSFVRDLSRVPIAMGMVSKTEVDYNLAYCKAAPDEIANLPELIIEEKCFQIVDFLCKDCGSCIETCPNHAIAKESDEIKPKIDPELCLRCGYCVGFCPQFAIRMT